MDRSGLQGRRRLPRQKDPHDSEHVLAVGNDRSFPQPQNPSNHHHRRLPGYQQNQKVRRDGNLHGQRHGLDRQGNVSWETNEDKSGIDLPKGEVIATASLGYSNEAYDDSDSLNLPPVARSDSRPPIGLVHQLSNPDVKQLGPRQRRRLRRLNYDGLLDALGDTGHVDLPGPHDIAHGNRKSLHPVDIPDADYDVEPAGVEFIQGSLRPRPTSNKLLNFSKRESIDRASVTISRRTFAKEDFNRDDTMQNLDEMLTGNEKWKKDRKEGLKQVRWRIREIGYVLELWRGSFKTIEASFGSAVLAYFLFVKWLFLINLFTSIVIISVIVLPHAILAPQTFNDSIHSAENKLSLPSLVEEALVCSEEYARGNRSVLIGNVYGDSVIDFLQGTGWMENTPLFIGHYYNKIFLYEDNMSYYNTALAFLLATLGYMLVTLISMVTYTAEGLRSLVTGSDDRFYHSCNTVFCGWDSSLTEEKAAKFKHNNIYTEFLNDQAEARQAERRRKMSARDRRRLYAMRTLVWLVTAALLGAAGYLIFKVINTWMPELLSSSNSAVSTNRFLVLLVGFLPSITITILNAIIPPIFKQMVVFEDYSPESEISITISRSVILRVASLMVLLITLGVQMQCSDPSKCGQCSRVTLCWETYVGQEMYKLVILDFFVVVLMTLLYEFPRRLLVKRFTENKLLKFVGRQEFDIPSNVLNIVYTQTICWVGGFFSPLIPIITVMKLFIFFYIRKVSLLKNLIPASRVYRASRATYFFMIVCLVTFVVCAAALLYAIGRIQPSKGCGPFRIYSSNRYYMSDVLDDAIQTLPAVLKDILNILGHWAFYVALVVILSLLIIYFRATAAANKYLASRLIEQLTLVMEMFLFLSWSPDMDPSGMMFPHYDFIQQWSLLCGYNRENYNNMICLGL